MPKLSRAREAQRLASVLQVIRITQQGLVKLSEALDEAGITKEQYDLCISRHPDVVDLFYKIIQESERRELTSILVAREKIVQNLLDKATSSLASVFDITAALSYLDKRQNELENRQGIADASEINASEYLMGPRTEHKASRLTATVTVGDATVTISTGQDPSEVIDTQFREVQPHQALLEADLEFPSQQPLTP